MQRMQLAEEEQDEIDAADAIAKAKGGRRTIGIHQAKAALRGTRTKTKTTTTRTSTKTTRKRAATAYNKNAARPVTSTADLEKQL